ncbi:hypothetical protein ACRRTK_001465 [Alexandromys fortis]
MFPMVLGHLEHSDCELRGRTLLSWAPTPCGPFTTLNTSCGSCTFTNSWQQNQERCRQNKVCMCRRSFSEHSGEQHCPRPAPGGCRLSSMRFPEPSSLH